MTGRTVQGVVDRSETAARFPSLTKQMTAMITSSAIRIAMDNYYAKYAELEQQKMQDYVKINERLASVQNKNSQEARRESARIACVGLDETAVAGDETDVGDETNAAQDTTVASTQGDAGRLASTDIVADEWNYKETVTSTFSYETLACHRCTRTQNCLDPKGGRKMCKEWADPVETCVDIQF